VTRRLLPALALAGLLAMPAVASAAPSPAPSGPPAATLKVRVGGLRGGRAPIYGTVPVTGSIAPYVAGQKVEVSFYRDSRSLLTRTLDVNKGAGGAGAFSTSIVIRRDGRYAVSATHPATPALGGDTTPRTTWKVRFPSLRPGQCGKVVGGFKGALARMGYVSGGGSCFNARLGREVLAYRKVNDMARDEQAGARLVQRAFDGHSGYRVRHPGAGEHAEVPLSKQVLVLAKGSRPFAIYPVSTGKPSTPTVTGHYHFYLRSPGYNSEGMYYSFYWYRGYAVHGYAEVPNYAASHGCVRTYIADQPRIYYQLHQGESIFVF
jgi:L,D-transpeptidase catalytic domain